MFPKIAPFFGGRGGGYIGTDGETADGAHAIPGLKIETWGTHFRAEATHGSIVVDWLLIPRKNFLLRSGIASGEE